MGNDQLAKRTRAVTDDLCGHAAISPDPRFEVRELGEIDMVSRALATLDLVTHDDALRAFPAVHPEDHTLSYGFLTQTPILDDVMLHPGASVCKAELAVHCGRRLVGHKIAKQL